jgi:hypothetical protein
MGLTKKQIDELIVNSEIAINNALTAADVFARIKIYHYDETRLNEGLDLCKKASRLDEEQKDKYTSFEQASAEVQKIWTVLKEQYYPDLALARIVFKKEKGLLIQLEGVGTRKTAMGARIKQTKVFYTNSLASEEIMEKLKTVGMTKESLKQGIKRVEKLEQVVARKEALKGEARRATKERDEVLIELRSWMWDFKRICLIALKGTQLPEKLGWTVPKDF